MKNIFKNIAVVSATLNVFWLRMFCDEEAI